MHRIISKLLNKDKKKVTLQDVASPQPSRSAIRVLNGALRRAYEDQQATRRKAQAIRAVKQ